LLGGASPSQNLLDTLVTKNLFFMIQLIGSAYDKITDVYTFFYHNTGTNWYYEMSCRNSFGTADMNARTPKMTREQFVVLAGDRLA
jgi:hypothetical protein